MKIAKREISVKPPLSMPLKPFKLFRIGHWLLNIDYCSRWINDQRPFSCSAKASTGFEGRQSYPAFSFVAKTEQFGMEQFSQNLQRFNQARPRTIEILIAVGDKDSILFYRFQLSPFGFAGQQTRLLHRARDVEAAGRDEDHVGIGRDQRLPTHPRRMLARLAEEVHTAGHLHQLRRPVARRHQRIDPFDTGHSRAQRRRSRLLRGFVHSPPQPRDEFFAAFRRVQSRGHATNVRPYVGQRVGFERDDDGLRACELAHSLLDVPEADRADLALRLGDNVRGPQTFEQIRVHAVNAQRLLQDRLDALVDLVAQTLYLELRAGANGQTFDRSGEVAFVRPPDNLRFEAQRANDLRGAGDE